MDNNIENISMKEFIELKHERKLTIFDVAIYFLRANKEISNDKLNALCFYAQVISSAIHNKPLFDEEFEAWEQGYVCPELYHNYDKLITSLENIKVQ